MRVLGPGPPRIGVSCGVGRTLQREPVGLGAAAREHDLVGAGAKIGRELLTCRFERGLRGACDTVPARRVPVDVGEERQHRLDDDRARRRGGRMVEVDEIARR